MARDKALASVNPAPMIINHGFETVEELQAYFSEFTGIISPQLTVGGSHFLRQFWSWVSAYEQGELSIEVFLPPEPAHAIAFPTPREFLNATLNAAHQLGNKTQLDELLQKFGLEMEKCDQPTYTLSGGERALFSLAKLSALGPFSKNVVVCNPARWLYPSRRHLIGESLSTVNPSAKRADFLYLHGEPSAPVGEVVPDNGFSCDRPWWKLEARRLKIVFPSFISAGRNDSRGLTFDTAEPSLELFSPTLITGDNGVGKSTFAKILSSVIDYESGHLSIKARGFQNASGRLLFQDIAEQLFALKPTDHLNRVFEYDEKLRDKAWEVFEHLQARVRELTGGVSSRVTLGTGDEPSSLLQSKLLLAAERLVSSAGVLIADEPTWGLSRLCGGAFVHAISEEASKLGIAFLVISHDTGLNPALFGSRLHFSRAKRAHEVKIEALDPKTPIA